jgi:hypothetical protein
MSPKHTPGDWIVLDLGCALSIRSSHHENVVATISVGNHVEPQRANANLITAAPDLLAAATAILDGGHVVSSDAFLNLRAARAKALGAA